MTRLNYDPPSETFAPHLDEADPTTQALATPDADAAAAAIYTPAAALDDGIESGAREISRGKSTPRARRRRQRGAGTACTHERRAGDRPPGAGRGDEHREPVADRHFL